MFSQEEIKERLEKLGKLSVELLPISKVKGVICTSGDKPIPMIVLEPAPEKLPRKFYRAIMTAFDKELQPSIVVRDDGSQMVIEFIEPVRVDKCENKLERKGKIPFEVAMDKPECAETYKNVTSNGYLGLLIIARRGCPACEDLETYLYGGGIEEEDPQLVDMAYSIIANAVWVDVDPKNGCPSFTRTFNVSSYPTIIAIIKGKEIDRLEGFNKEELKNILKRLSFEIVNIEDALYKKK